MAVDKEFQEFLNRIKAMPEAEKAKLRAGIYEDAGLKPVQPAPRPGEKK